MRTIIFSHDPLIAGKNSDRFKGCSPNVMETDRENNNLLGCGNPNITQIKAPVKGVHHDSVYLV